MAENKNESTLRDAANASKNTVDAVKGVKSVGKMAGQIAAGDWLGAIKEFFKNPQGILTAILAPSLAIILLITYITSTLVGTVWGIITDDVAKSMVDDYQYMENAVGVKSFTPAYKYVSEQALAEVCEKVKALDLEEFDDVSEKVIFKDAETLQNWLGKGYQQMCKFSDNGNTYTGYMNVQNGMSGVFALMQDESNGYEVSYDNTNSDYTAWQKTVSIYDFGNTTVGITGAPKYASLEGDKIRNSQKALYNITYNNQKFKQDGISVAMFQTIYNLVYDYNKTAYVNSNECSQTVNLIANLEQAEEIRGSNTVNYESFGSYLYNMILSASFDSNGLFNENYLLAEQASQQYQKKYYAVYCQPSTIVTLPFAAYRTNFLGEQMTHSKWKDFWYGNHVSDSTGGLNVIVSRIPASHLQPYSKESNEDYQIRLQKWNKENENPLTTEYWNSTDYDEYKKFDYLSYSLCNNAYMFDVLNLQISMPDTNGNTHFLTGEDYKLNYGSNYLHYSGMMDTEYKTATEVLEENADVSAFQLNSEGGSPVILGTSLMQDLYPKNLSYDVNDPDTYPYFVVSVSLAPAIQSENVKYKELSIYDVFDLDVVQDKSYIDKTTGYCWPVVQSYEHASVVTSTVDNGTIVAINKDAQYIIYKNSNGDYRKVSNIIPDDELYVGSKIFKGTTVLGRVPDGLMAQISRGGLTSEGKYKEANPLNAGSYLMTTTNISLRSDTALGEDSVGIFTKILSMMNGEVVDITRNTQGKNDGSIVICSVENDLYYEYTNIGISPFIKVGDTISSNSRIGQAYVYVNDTTSKVGFRVYNVEQDSFGITTKVYLNPIQFFPDLSNVESSAKRIVIKNEDAEDGETLKRAVLRNRKICCGFIPIRSFFYKGCIRSRNINRHSNIRCYQ